MTYDGTRREGEDGGPEPDMRDSWQEAMHHIAQLQARVTELLTELREARKLWWDLTADNIRLETRVAFMDEDNYHHKGRADQLAKELASMHGVAVAWEMKAMSAGVESGMLKDLLDKIEEEELEPGDLDLPSVTRPQALLLIDSAVEVGELRPVLLPDGELPFVQLQQDQKSIPDQESAPCQNAITATTAASGLKPNVGDDKENAAPHDTSFQVAAIVDVNTRNNPDDIRVLGEEPRQFGRELPTSAASVPQKKPNHQVKL